MTKEQYNTLKFIYNFIKSNIYSPSIKEVQKGTNRNSYTSAAQTIRQLNFRGYISTTSHLKRSIKLTDQGLEIFEVEQSNRELKKFTFFLRELSLTKILKNKLFKVIAKDLK